MKIICLVFAGMALAGTGCVKPQIFVTPHPKLDEIKKTGRGAEILLEAFTDERLEYKEDVVGSQSEKTTFNLTAPNTPKKMVRDSIKDLLWKAGYQVEQDLSKKSKSSIVLKGAVKRFEIALSINKFSRAFVFDAFADFNLTFERNGKPILEKSFSGENRRHSMNNFIVNKPDLYETVMTAALESAFDQAADFIESEEFQSMIRGKSAAAAKKGDSGALEERLEKLVEMKKSGALSESEFKKAKAKILGN